MNFLNHKEWKIIMDNLNNQQCNYPCFKPPNTISNLNIFLISAGLPADLDDDDGDDVQNTSSQMEDLEIGRQDSSSLHQSNKHSSGNYVKNTYKHFINILLIKLMRQDLNLIMPISSNICMQCSTTLCDHLCIDINTFVTMHLILHNLCNNFKNILCNVEGPC